MKNKILAVVLLFLPFQYLFADFVGNVSSNATLNGNTNGTVSVGSLADWYSTSGWSNNAYPTSNVHFYSTSNSESYTATNGEKFIIGGAGASGQFLNLGNPTNQPGRSVWFFLNCNNANSLYLAGGWKYGFYTASGTFSNFTSCTISQPNNNPLWLKFDSDGKYWNTLEVTGKIRETVPYYALVEQGITNVTIGSAVGGGSLSFATGKLTYFPDSNSASTVSDGGGIFLTGASCWQTSVVAAANVTSISVNVPTGTVFNITCRVKTTAQANATLFGLGLNGDTGLTSCNGIIKIYNNGTINFIQQTNFCYISEVLSNDMFAVVNTTLSIVATNTGVWHNSCIRPTGGTQNDSTYGITNCLPYCTNIVLFSTVSNTMSNGQTSITITKVK